MKKILVSSVCFLLASCANQPHYQGAQAGSNFATIQGSTYKKGLVNWRSTSVLSIDGKSIGMVWSSESKINLSPGPHVIRVYGEIAAGFVNGNYYAKGNVSFTAKPHQNYIVEMTGNTDEIQFWIANNSGKSVSAKVSKPAFRIGDVSLLQAIGHEMSKKGS
jgi:hypothetical protein